MIFYFTGTGNSLSIARKIAAFQGERLVSIAKAMKDENFVLELDREEKVGFIFPVHAWAPPKLVLEFVGKLQLQCFLNPYLFAVCTCGDEAGEAISVFRSALRKKLWRLSAGAELQMPNNYLPMYDVDTAEEQKKKLVEAESLVRIINERIARREEGRLSEIPGAFPKFKSRIVAPLFQKFACSARPFWTNDRCTRCGLCEKICPTGTISLGDTGPVWGKTCTQCMACINRCPVKAIQYGKSTVHKGRYIHPDAFQDADA